jgi:putative drug exporter of the RND superfamily
LISDQLFYRFGKMIYHVRWFILIIWLAAVFACIPLLPKVVTVFQSTGFSVDNAKSVKADQLLAQTFGHGTNKFIILYSSKALKTSDPLFMSKVKQSLASVSKYKYKTTIIYPADNKNQIAKDKRSAYAVILVKSTTALAGDELTKFKSLIKEPKNMTVVMGGEPLFVESVNTQTQKDLFAADIIAAPVTIIMMLFIFESIVGAMIPVMTGAGCAIMILSLLYIIGKHYVLSIFTLNIALLLGLCLSLDYALFIVSRFRFELRNGHSVMAAIAITQATAGKAVFFSGLAVFVSLSALLMFPINILFSVGVGGLCAVFVAVVTANMVLPSILSILGQRVNCLAIGALTTIENGRSPFWHWLVSKVVKHPYVYFTVVMTILLTMSYPVLHAKFGISDYKILPPHADGREFFTEFNGQFNQNTLTPVQLIFQSNTNILSQKNITRMQDIAKKIKARDDVHSVDGVVMTDPVRKPLEYYMVYKMPKERMDNGIKTLLKTTTDDKLSVLTIVSRYPVNSEETRDLVNDLGAIQYKSGMTGQVAGVTLRNMEVFSSIKSIYPCAIAAIMLFTYLILLVLLRSIVLPFKAILTTILSLTASYGVLVFIIQEGHLSQLLHFEPQAMLDVSLLVIIFCALFGFSMDYEVFLLSRIKEHYDETGDNTQSIIYGVEQSSRIITSAAVIVIAICCSFMVADVLMVKAFGLGIAVAIFTDAFLIRSLLVPAVMTILGRANWYLPKWLSYLLPKM